MRPQEYKRFVAHLRMLGFEPRPNLADPIGKQENKVWCLFRSWDTDVMVRFKRYSRKRATTKCLISELSSGMLIPGSKKWQFKSGEHGIAKVNELIQQGST